MSSRAAGFPANPAGKGSKFDVKSRFNVPQPRIKKQNVDPVCSSSPPSSVPAAIRRPGASLFAPSVERFPADARSCAAPSPRCSVCVKLSGTC